MSAATAYPAAELSGALRVVCPSGRVRVVAGPGDAVRIERGTGRVVDGRLEVGADHGVAEVVVPHGTDVVVGTASARVELRGVLGSVAVTTSSGRIELERARTADLRTGSGRIDVGEVAELLRLETGSGGAQVSAAAALEAGTVSGRLVAAVGERAAVRTVSGRVVLVMRGAAPDVDVETVAGRVEVLVPAGVQPRFDLTSRGQVRVGVPEGDAGAVRVRAVSGRVSVEHAP